MHILSIFDNNISSVAYEAANLFKQGFVGIYPTETLYGIGSSIENENSVIRCNLVKNRHENTPQILLIRFEWIERYIVNYKQYLPLLSALWDGPFTIILESNLDLPFETKSKVAFRVSPHPFVDKVLEYLDSPITSTSANLSSSEPMIRLTDIVDYFDDKVEFLVYDKNDDPGWRKPKLPEPSVMIDATGFPEKIKIVRGNPESLSKINRLFPKLEVIR